MLLANALKVGLSVSEFWSLTPRELSMRFEAVGWQQEQKWQRDVMLAWHMAAFIRSRRLPDLKTILNPGETKVLTPEEKAKRAAEFDRLNARMGAHRGRRK